ncbi:MAG: hypothetical protein KDD44_11960, partial [Bdellovibrionales bacterium]|nr:hypothetical protein [Bdellovibrionales bacterium]
MSPEEFARLRAQWSLDERVRLEGAIEQHRGFLREAVTPEMHAVSVTNSTGNYLKTCSQVTEGFFCRNAQRVQHSYCLENAEDVCDTYAGGGNLAEVAQCVSVGFDVRRMFNCVECW